jgi:hypothetical protein
MTTLRNDPMIRPTSPQKTTRSAVTRNCLPHPARQPEYSNHNVLLMTFTNGVTELGS